MKLGKKKIQAPSSLLPSFPLLLCPERRACQTPGRVVVSSSTGLRVCESESVCHTHSRLLKRETREKAGATATTEEGHQHHQASDDALIQRRMRCQRHRTL